MAGLALFNLRVLCYNEAKGGDEMVYVTGDIHGDPGRILWFCECKQLTQEDVIVLLGDVAANYDLGPRDEWVKDRLSKVLPTVLCIHGNHEARPETVIGYQQMQWRGGAVYYQSQYPNLLFAKDGEIYSLAGRRCMAIGGAYSVDKQYRVGRGWPWFADEQPSEQIKAYVERQLAENQVDVVFSHTCPDRYKPVECFLSGINQACVDDSTERWLGALEQRIAYDAWYCGHWHINKRIDKIHFLFEGYELLESKA